MARGIDRVAHTAAPQFQIGVIVSMTVVILVIMVTGLFVMAYARFRRFPPLFEAYEQQLARQRYLARARNSRPEATIRSKQGTRRRGGKRH